MLRTWEDHRRVVHWQDQEISERWAKRVHPLCSRYLLSMMMIVQVKDYWKRIIISKHLWYDKQASPRPQRSSNIYSVSTFENNFNISMRLQCILNPRTLLRIAYAPNSLKLNSSVIEFFPFSSFTYQIKFLIEFLKF